MAGEKSVYAMLAVGMVVDRLLVDRSPDPEQVQRMMALVIQASQRVVVVNWMAF